MIIVSQEITLTGKRLLFKNRFDSGFEVRGGEKKGGGISDPRIFNGVREVSREKKDVPFPDLVSLVTGGDPKRAQKGLDKNEGGPRGIGRREAFFRRKKKFAGKKIGPGGEVRIDFIARLAILPLKGAFARPSQKNPAGKGNVFLE